MTDPQPWFVTCDECNGSAVMVVGHGHFADGSENNEEVPCPACKGAGVVEVLTTTAVYGDDEGFRAPLIPVEAA